MTGEEVESDEVETDGVFVFFETTCPGLLGLEEDGDGWVGETGEEDKVDDVADVVVDFRELEDV